MTRVLVTGGAGFIGSNLTAALLKQGDSVRVLDNFSSGKRENLFFEKGYSTLEVIEGDITDYQSCQSVMKTVECVFHQAALPSVPQSVEDPLTSNRVNVEGTLNVLLAARDAGVKRVVYASSCAIYGDDPTLPKKEDMAPHPLSPYALQKYVGERYCLLFSSLYQVETVSLRYFNVFGPKQDPNSFYAAAIPRFIDALLDGRSPVVFGDGEQSRDFVFIDDVVQANLLAMSAHPLCGDVVNVAHGRSLSINELLAILKDLLGSKILPDYEEPRTGDVRHSLGDIQRGKQLLNYAPRVEMREGLAKTVAYFKSKRKEMLRR
jgi:nucleoside-diphosphate-sugar epimerase